MKKKLIDFVADTIFGKTPKMTAREQEFLNKNLRSKADQLVEKGSNTPHSLKRSDFEKSLYEEFENNPNIQKHYRNADEYISDTIRNSKPVGYSGKIDPDVVPFAMASPLVLKYMESQDKPLEDMGIGF